MNSLVRTTNSKFYKIKCEKCKNEQVVFSKAASKVVCLACGAELVTPTGGEAVIKNAKKLEVLA